MFFCWEEARGDVCGHRSKPSKHGEHGEGRLREERGGLRGSTQRRERDDPTTTPRTVDRLRDSFPFISCPRRLPPRNESLDRNHAAVNQASAVDALWRHPNLEAWQLTCISTGERKRRHVQKQKTSKGNAHFTTDKGLKISFSSKFQASGPGETAGVFPFYIKTDQDGRHKLYWNAFPCPPSDRSIKRCFWRRFRGDVRFLLSPACRAYRVADFPCPKATCAGSRADTHKLCIIHLLRPR